MVLLFLLMMLVVYLASIEQRNVEYELYYSESKVRKGLGFYAACVLLILVFGFRTGFNDTATYIQNFDAINVDGLSNAFKYAADSKYGGYGFFNYVFKAIVSSDAGAFILVYTVFFVVGFMWIYRHTSEDFCWTVFFFICSGLLLFGMAAIKQITAMTLWYIGYVKFEQGKKKQAFLLWALAPTFHVYAVFLFVLLLMRKKAWSGLMLAIILASIVMVFSFDTFIGIASDVTESFGITYDMNDLILNKRGMNILRVVMYTVVPGLSWMLRDTVNKEGNPYVIMGCNASILTLAFFLISLNGGANAIGRIAYYFAPLSFVSLPWLVNRMWNNVQIVKIGLTVAFLISYWGQYSRYAAYFMQMINGTTF